MMAAGPPRSTTHEDRVSALVAAYFGIELQAEQLARMQQVTLGGGEWLFRQGDPGDALYLVVRGRLQAWAEPPPATGETELPESRLLGELGPGDSVGEVSLLTGEPRMAGVRAARDSLMIRIDHDLFEDLGISHPRLSLNLAGNVARMLQHGPSSRVRAAHAIALLPLRSEGPEAEFCRQLASHLAAEHDCLYLEARRLVDAGAPAGDIGEALKQWLADQEEQRDYLLYQCDPGQSAWTAFATRQSDVVLLVADADAEPDAARDVLESLGTDDSLRAQKYLVRLHRAGQAIRDTRPWLDRCRPHYYLHIGRSNLADLQRLARVLAGQATGLVLGAGAARGLSQIGVYRALHEAGVDIDWVGGTSIGSIVGAAIALRWEPEQLMEAGRESFVAGKPFSDYTLPVVSLLRGRRMRRLLTAQMDVQIEDLDLPYFCVSSNLGRGVMHVHERGSLVEAICASAALPGIMPPAVVDRELAVDGSVLNSLPVDVMRARPVGRVIAVDLSSAAHISVDYPQVPSPWAILRSRWLPFAKRIRVPNLLTLMLKSTEIGTLEQIRTNGQSADLLLRPPVRRFGITDVKAFDQLVEAGYRHTLEALEGWTQEQGPRAG
ncbi:MAG: cyclic nucleotide-binding domain-containing protein [Xanthomonadales bacterium]|nr:cyclic nucleotide-binding domain-containing protein [Xanthomonadales bacterium]NIN75190.1 cyclic nucleotide-binding domain-containing protein [Xanthomonadales bacterium]NIP12208.1 cyclic nucleotide-binding domain-containing protein [Xanthomonadales bacterium]NIP76454.1 cyclic nucleotide-binding domain-containing protein [Xanthomonadales bacterium]NIQ35856.1 cyclic nucleotide-binding domain-containing protein [Xanthomonadales bacterium]